jgi:hypothetical protein
MKIACLYLGNQCPRALRLASSSIPGFNFELHQVRFEAKFFSRLVNLLLLLCGFFDSYIQRKSYPLPKFINSYDGIICHDLLLLPTILNKCPELPIVVDLREYYPEQFSNSPFWMWTWGRLYTYLCKTKLHSIPKLVTVSAGLAKRYHDEFGLAPTTVPSYATRHEITPHRTKPSIKLVHHGNASHGRELENMIYAMDYLGDHFSLDLFLVAKDVRYYKFLTKCAESRINVTIKKPIPFDQIIETISKYDIGLFTSPPTTTNLRYALPNKIFEYVQARLMIISTPLEDIVRVVDEYSLGIITKDHTAKNIAKVLSVLEPSDIDRYKAHASIAANALNSERSSAMFSKLFLPFSPD